MSELAGLQITKMDLVRQCDQCGEVLQISREGDTAWCGNCRLFFWLSSTGELKQIDFDELLALAGPCENCGGSLLICGEGNTLVCDRCRIFWWVSESGRLSPRTFGETPPPTNPQDDLRDAIERQKKNRN